MKTYSDLQDIDTDLHVQITLQPVGEPDVTLIVAGESGIFNKLSDRITLDYRIGLLDLFSISVELLNKTHSVNYETAVIVKQLRIDNIEMVPKYDYLAYYDNDHGCHDPTSYLGFNGKWTLTFDSPFYHWLHQKSGQGWLYD